MDHKTNKIGKQEFDSQFVSNLVDLVVGADGMDRFGREVLVGVGNNSNSVVFSLYGAVVEMGVGWAGSNGKCWLRDRGE